MAQKSCCSLSCTSTGRLTAKGGLWTVPGQAELPSMQALEFPGRRKHSQGSTKAGCNSEIALSMAWFLAFMASWEFGNLLAKSFCLLIIYLISKYTYRLLLCPIAGFPGPRVAGITRLYEAYHVLIRNDWLENLISLHEKYGPVVRIGPNELHFVDHEFCLEHHKRPDLLKCGNYYGLLDNLLGGLASPGKHSERAAVMRPIFSGETLTGFSRTLDRHLESLHSRLTDAAADMEAVNMTHYLWAFTNDVMISYLTEGDYGFQKVFDLGAVHDSTRAFSAIDLATVLRCIPPVKMMFETFPALRAYSPLSWVDSLIDSHVRPIVKSWDDESGHEGVLARMFEGIGNEIKVVHESSQAIFIGNESLLSNLTFALHHLIKNPECVKKLRAELDTLDLGLYGHRVWRDPKVLHLRYLDGVCKESSRLSSPGWHRQPRQSRNPVMYRNTEIPSMTSMSFTLSLLGHDPILYPEPDSFKPERWIGLSDESMRTRGQSVIFGTGTRICLGQHIAYRVLRKTVAFLVYNFNVSLLDEEADRMGGYRYLDTYPKKGHEGYMKVQLTPRFGHHA